MGRVDRIETVVVIALMTVFTAVLIIAFPVEHGNVPQLALRVGAVLLMVLVLSLLPRRVARWFAGRRQP